MDDRAVFPGEVRQVGHVVADLDAAMQQWLVLGVGPWIVIDVDQRTSYRGHEHDVRTSIGFAHSGTMQIELIQAHATATSAWHEARDRRRFGVHHIAYWTDDFDAAMARALGASLPVVQEGDGNGMARFVYVEVPGSATLVEIMELTDLSRAFMEGIRADGEGWDGTERPVRR
jgi:catechol 2,3-dioxygenase-like lactoylglutathione lyase family enzyme